MIRVLPQNHRANLARSSKSERIQNIVLWRIDGLFRTHRLDAGKQGLGIRRNVSGQQREPCIDILLSIHKHHAFHWRPQRRP